MAELKFDITGDNTDLLRKMEQVKSEMASAKTQADATGFAINDMLKQTAAFAGVSLGAAGIKELCSSMISARKEMQGFQTSLDVLLGDGDKADSMFRELNDFAVKTPLMLQDLAGGAQTMLGFNIAAEEVVPTLKEIGDISMGDSAKFNSLVLAFSQMSATGKLMGQDLLQMINAGFNPLSEISRKTGKSIAELKDEMSAGAISSQMVADAFKSATSEGGQFYGMIEAQGKTLSGQINTLQGAVKDMLNALGTESEGIISGAIGALTALAQNYEKVGVAVAGIAGTYGTYMAASKAVAVLMGIETAGAKAAAGAQGIHAVAIGVVTKAQAALNAVMAVNPYVAAATAIAALAAAMWYFRDSSTAAEAGAKAYNERLKERAELEKKATEETEKGIAVLQGETASEYERQKALDALKRKYPDIFADYDTESVKLANILDLKRQIADADRDRRREDIKEDIKGIDAEIARYGSSAGNGRKVNELVELRKEARRELGKYIADDYASGLDDTDEATKQKYITELERRVKGKKDSEEISLRLPGKDGQLGDEGIISVEDVKSMIDLTKSKSKAKTEAATTYQQEAGRAYNDWSKAKATYEELKESVTATTKEVQDARQKMEEADKRYKEVTGQSASQTAKAGAKDVASTAKDALAIADLKRKQSRESSAMDISLAREYEQAEIDAMEEGNEKKTRQLNLDHQKELDSINQWYQAMKDTAVANERELWEAQNMAGTWSAGMQEDAENRADGNQKLSGLYKAKTAAADRSYLDSLKELAKEEQQHMTEYLKLYGDMQQKKLAIAREYDEKISKASDEWQRRSLQAEKDEYISRLDRRQTMQHVEAVGSASDMAIGIIAPAMEGIRRQIDQEMKSPDFSLKSAQEQQNVLETNEMLNELGVFSDDVKDVRTAARELKDAIERSITAEDNMNRATEMYQASQSRTDGLRERQQKAQAELTSAEGQLKLDNGDSEENTEQLQEQVNLSQQILDVVNDLLEQSIEDTESLKSAMVSAGTEARQAESAENLARARLSSSESKSQDSGNKMAATIQQYSSPSNILNTIGQNMGGMWGGALQILAQVGDDAGGFVDEVVSGVSDIVSSLIEQLLSGEFLEKAIGSLGSLFTDFTEAFSFGALEGNIDDVEKTTAELVERNTSLQAAIEDLADVMEEAYSITDIVDASRQMIDAEKEIEANQQESVGEWLSAWDDHHSAAYNINSSRDWQRYRSEINSALSEHGIDESVTDAQSIADLSAEAMNIVRTYADSAYKFVYSSSEFSDKVKDAMDSLADSAGKIDEYTETLQQKLTSISFDSMYDNFVSTLMDMNSSASDFASSVSEYMMKAVLGNMMSEKYKERLKNWYVSYADAIAAGNGQLAESEIAKYKEMYEDIASEAIEDRNKLADITGYDGGSATSASSGVSESVTQDSVDEANGRMAALQMGQQTLIAQGIQIVSGVGELKSTMDDILSGNAVRNNYLADMYERMGRMQATIGDYLTQICENTKNI